MVVIFLANEKLIGVRILMLGGGVQIPVVLLHSVNLYYCGFPFNSP